MTDGQSLALVRAIHTAIYVAMSSAVLAVISAGVAGAEGLWLTIALAMVTVEVAVFVAFGLKCPLTAIASTYGASPRSDTFFPEAITKHTLRFFGPLLTIAMGLLVARWCNLLGPS